MSLTARVRRHGPFAATSLAAIGLLVAAYANHFANGFHFDDSHVIVNNVAIRSLAAAPTFFTDPTTYSALPTHAIYRPLLTLSYALDYRLAGGLDPRPFHRTQFFLLVLLGGLLVVFYRRMFELGSPSPWNRWAALFAATLFCVHTANTQTVNYLSSRSSLLATLGVVASLVIFIAWPRGRWTLLYLLPMIVGGLAKALVVMGAPLLLVYLFLFEQRAGPSDLRSAEGWRKLRRAALGSAPALAAGALLFVFLSGMDADTLLLSEHSRWHYLQTQPFVWLHYFRLFLLPLGLTADTDWGVITHWYDTRLFAGALFLAALAAAAWRLSSRSEWKPAAFGLVWFAVALAPTSSIVPLGEVYNEHRIFFPYVGLTLAAVWVAVRVLARLAGEAPSRRRIMAASALALGLAILLAYAAGTHRRNLVWKDEESLWRDVVEKSPRNGRGLMNYGLTRMSQGDFPGALALYERALVYTPNYSLLHINLGIVKSAMGQDEAAETHFRQALQFAPHSHPAHFYFARWLAGRKRGPEALAHLETAIELNPRDADARQLLLRLFAASGSEVPLLDLAQKTLELAPGDRIASAYAAGRIPFAVGDETTESYFARGLELIGSEQWIDAAVVYRRALELDSASAVGWNNLGWARLKLGFLEPAAPCFRRAFELDPTMEVAQNNLRWILSELAAAPPGDRPR